MNIKKITIVECNHCRWLRTDVYQNRYACMHEENLNNTIYAPTIIPDECPLEDGE